MIFDWGLSDVIRRYPRLNICFVLLNLQEGKMIKDKAYYDSLTEQIICCAYKVGNHLGSGFLEKVYENALAIELKAVVVKEAVAIFKRPSLGLSL